MFTLIAGEGAAERTAVSYRNDYVMATGFGNRWKDYVHLLSMWAKDPSELPAKEDRYYDFDRALAQYSTDQAEEMNTRIGQAFKSAKIELPSDSAKYPYLAHLNDFLSENHLETYDDLVRAEGADSPYATAMRSIISAFTTESPKISKHFGRLTVKDGKPISYNNEVTINNATVAGIGILTRGKPVFFEGVTTPAELRQIFRKVKNSQDG